MRYLKNQQSKKDDTGRGSSSACLADMEGGVTALATLALLNCGLRADDPTVKKALEYLETLSPRQDLRRRPADDGLRRDAARRTAPHPARTPMVDLQGDRLARQRSVEGGAGNSRGGATRTDLADNSNTQYALLGLYAAKTAEAKIDDKVWKAILEFYTRTQQAAAPTAGYWGYYNDRRRQSFSMTVAGVCGCSSPRWASTRASSNSTRPPGVAANCGCYTENAALGQGDELDRRATSTSSPRSRRSTTSTASSGSAGSPVSGSSASSTGTRRAARSSSASCRRRRSDAGARRQQERASTRRRSSRPRSPCCSSPRAARRS